MLSIRSAVEFSAQQRSPLTDRFALFESAPLDVDAMQIASNTLVGIHDFATFGQPTQGENTVREVYEANGWSMRMDFRLLVTPRRTCGCFYNFCQWFFAPYGAEYCRDFIGGWQG